MKNNKNNDKQLNKSNVTQKEKVLYDKSITTENFNVKKSRSENTGLERSINRNIFEIDIEPDKKK